MVLASLNFKITELELRNLCECNETGTYTSKVLTAIEGLGFSCYEANLTIEELRENVLYDLNPIVFLKFDPEINYSHAVVVHKISKGKIFVLDPEIGEREFELIAFTGIWSRGLSIIVEKKLA